MSQLITQTITQTINEQRELFRSGLTRPIKYRLEQLDKLRQGILKYEREILDALKRDLNKPEYEAYATEVGLVLHSIGHISKNLEKWAKVKVVKTPIQLAPAKSSIKYEPQGVVLIVAPFNYPFQLLIEPLLGAIAAGNTAVLKPSEYTSHTEAIIVKLFAELFDPNYIKVITGGRDVSEALVNAPFDHIFFTGSTQTGKAVMKAAAEHLIPVTLELGGKSPTIVHNDADIKMAALRITWGKFMNAGQICVAPDYVYVHKDVEQLFIDEVLKCIITFYGALPIKSPDYCRIVNENLFNRIVSLIDHDKVVIGGQYDLSQKYIAPTVMKNVTWDDAVMQEEIFGPIMPILVYDSIETVIDTITQKPKPLALYVFSESESLQEYLMDQIPFGGGCINDTIMHVASQYLPFGGTGHSGMGAYHGEESFKTFSHKKSILKKSSVFELKLLYPPYKNNVQWLRKIFK